MRIRLAPQDAGKLIDFAPLEHTLANGALRDREEDAQRNGQREQEDDRSGRARADARRRFFCPADVEFVVHERGMFIRPSSRGLPRGSGSISAGSARCPGGLGFG